MRYLLGKILLYIFSNSIALFIAAQVVPGFELAADFVSVLTVAAMFTALNIILRPILQFLLSPIILLTLGLAIVALNAFLLYILDFWSEKITIAGTIPLLYATVIVGVVNMVLHFLTHSFPKKASELE